MNQDSLMDWFNRNKRSLPWRKNPSPWSILLSEILLQQTQMERGIEYHHRLYHTQEQGVFMRYLRLLLLIMGARYLQLTMNYLPYQELAPTLRQQLLRLLSLIQLLALMETFAELWPVRQTMKIQLLSMCKSMRIGISCVNIQAIGIKL